MKRYLLPLLFVFTLLLSACGQTNKVSLNTSNSSGTNNEIEKLKSKLEKVKLENEELKKKIVENKVDGKNVKEKKVERKYDKENVSKKIVDSTYDITYGKECFKKLSFNAFKKYTEKALWEKSSFLEKCLDKTIPCPIYKKVDDFWTEKNIPSYKSYLFSAHDGTISTPTNDNFSRWLLVVKKNMFRCMKYSGQAKVDDKAKVVIDYNIKNKKQLEEELKNEFNNIAFYGDTSENDKRCYISVNDFNGGRYKLERKGGKYIKGCKLDGVESIGVIQKMERGENKEDLLTKLYDKKTGYFEYTFPSKGDLWNQENSFIFVFHTKYGDIKIDSNIVLDKDGYLWQVTKKELVTKQYKILYKAYESGGPGNKLYIKIDFISLGDGYFIVYNVEGGGCGGSSYNIKISDKLKTLLSEKINIKSKLDVNNIVYNKSKIYIIPNGDEKLVKDIKNDLIYNKVYSSKTFKEDIYKDIKSKNKILQQVIVKYNGKDYNLPFDIYVKYDIDSKFIVEKYVPGNDVTVFLLKKLKIQKKDNFKIKVKDLPLEIKSDGKYTPSKVNLLFPITDIKNDDVIDCNTLNKDYFMCKPKRKLQIMAELCKPAIYTYNWNGENQVKLDLPQGGYYTKLIPEFNIKNGWEYNSKDNKVIFDGKKYPYLYYAVKVYNYKYNKNGWIVKGEDIEKFFKEKLEKIGFNKQEEKDFIEYWTHKYKKGHYYFVSFKYTEKFDNYVKLHFKNTPNKMNRVLMESYELKDYNKDYVYPSKYEKYLDKKVIRNLKRGGEKEIFEWGGTLIDLDGNSYIF